MKGKDKHKDDKDRPIELTVPDNDLPGVDLIARSNRFGVSIKPLATGGQDYTTESGNDWTLAPGETLIEITGGDHKAIMGFLGAVRPASRHLRRHRGKQKLQ